MTLYARVEDQIVHDLFTPPDGMLLADCFVPSVAAQFVEVPVDATPMPEIGWAYDGKNFSVRVPRALTKDELVNYANAQQRKILTDGKSFNVAPSSSPAQMVLCDGTNNTRADLALLVIEAQADSTASGAWVDNTGVTTTLTAAQFIALASAVGPWVKTTYAVLSQIYADIASGKTTTTAQIDAAFPAGASP